MGFTRSKDLDCYKEGRQKMGFGRSKNLKLYRNKQEKRFDKGGGRKKMSAYAIHNQQMVWLGLNLAHPTTPITLDYSNHPSTPIPAWTPVLSRFFSQVSFGGEIEVKRVIRSNKCTKSNNAAPLLDSVLLPDLRMPTAQLYEMIFEFPFQISKTLYFC